MDLHLLSQSGHLQTATVSGKANLSLSPAGISPGHSGPLLCTCQSCCSAVSGHWPPGRAQGWWQNPAYLCHPLPARATSGWVGALLAALLAASLPLHPCPGHRSIHHSLRDVGSLSSAQLCPLLASSPGGWAAMRAALGSAPGVPSMWLAGCARTLGSAAGELKPLSATYMAGRQESEDAEVLGRL